jgi:ankyrin repeat protein
MRKFIELCKNGNIIEIKDYISKNSNIENYEFEKGWMYACNNGNLVLAKWLLEINPLINISVDNNSVFYYACISGNLEIAKWLISINPNIDISYDNEFVFCSVCENGQLDVAKWLLEIKPDIDITICNEYPFFSAIENMRLNVVEWFTTLNKKYIVEMNNNKIISFSIDNS